MRGDKTSYDVAREGGLQPQERNYASRAIRATGRAIARSAGFVADLFMSAHVQQDRIYAEQVKAIDKYGPPHSL